MSMLTGDWFFCILKSAEMFVQDAAVPNVTMCVMFFALRCGATNRLICARSHYATFSTIAAIGVREMTACVAFGAPHFGVFFLATWRHPAVDQIGGGFAPTRISAFAVLNLHWVSACGEFLCWEWWTSFTCGDNCLRRCCSLSVWDRLLTCSAAVIAMAPAAR